MSKLSGNPVESLKEIYELLSRLKEVKRAGWLERGVREPESVADHSFNVTALSIILAEIKGLDIAEVARMAIIHDLPEAITGDLTPSQKKERIKEIREMEEEILRSITEYMPREIGEKYLEAWRELIEDGSQEAKLVKLIDKLEMGLQAAKYIKKTGNKKLLEIYYSAVESVKEDPELLNLLEKALHQ
jgi:putative hydrolase of HD superfamily